MLIHELLNKDTFIVPESEPRIILDSKSSGCMDKNGNNIKHTRKIARRVYLMRNVENCKMKKNEWYEGGMQLEDIVTKNFEENDLNTRMKYIMARIVN